MSFTEVTHRYTRRPQPLGHNTLHIPLDDSRPGAELRAELADPGLLRDGLLVLADVLASDLRHQTRDRADYLAYLLSKGKRTSQAVWDAQKTFLAARYGEAMQDQAPLDPLLSVTPDGLEFEVFSRDESTYARLHLKAGDGFRVERQTAGTSHFAFDPPLLEALRALRDYRPSQIDCRAGTAAGGEDRRRRVPYRWLRAFGQVQAAATLPAQRLQLDPIDLYNVLLSLRLRKAKRAPRALRFELTPGQAPRLVLEPWEQILAATGPAYSGDVPLVVRTWGRQRLSLLSRLLARTQTVDVTLLGAGLPAFYRLDCGVLTLTLALSGWTDSGWAGVASFDLLTPTEPDELLAKRVLEALRRTPRSLDELAAELPGERSRQGLRQTLLAEILKGRLLVDIASGRYRYRELTTEPLDLDQLRYRDAGEEHAHRLLAEPDQVRLRRVHDLGDGNEIDGEVDDRQAHRRYRCSFTVDREGRTVNAGCSCRQFRRSGLKQGPCPHMIALRLSYLRQQQRLEQARQTEAGRKLIRAETRTLVRHRGDRAHSVRLTLDERQVVQRWGDQQRRMQRLLFASAERARDDYFDRLDRLLAQGYIDASAADQA